MIDAWVLLALLPAVKSGQDILVDASVSQDMMFTLENSLIQLFSSLYNKKTKIQVIPKQVVSLSEHGFAVGCGCSLGVDSLSAIKRYSSKSLDPAFRLTHLALFNIGSFGNNDLNMASLAYQRTFNKASAFANEVGMPLVGVESNASMIYRDWEYEQVHTICNLSVVFAMRKLFRVYYYASSYPIEETKVNSESMSYLDSILIPLLSSNNFRLFVADADKDRVSKTKYIMNDVLTQKYLTVCWQDINDNGTYVIDNQFNVMLRRGG